jgi:hypothetical protein
MSERESAGSPRDRGHFRQAEIENLEAIARQDEQILWLEVAMDDALLVRGSEARRDLRAIVDACRDRQRPVVQPLAQCRALEELGDEVRRALVYTDVVDRQYRRMVQSCCRSRFLLESLEAIRVGRKLPGQQLDRDVTTEPGIAAAIHLSHPAGAEKVDDFVGAESCSRRQAQQRFQPVRS